MRRFLFDLLRPGCFPFFPLTLRVCFQVALIDHKLALELVGLVGIILLVEKLLLVAVEQLLLVAVERLLAVVDQLLNLFLLSNRDVQRSLAAFSYKTSPVFNLTTFGIL